VTIRSIDTNETNSQAQSKGLRGAHSNHEVEWLKDPDRKG